MLKKSLLSVCVLALGLAWAKPAAAGDTILFDPNGGGDGYLQVTSLDWNAGNAIAVGVKANSAPGTTFQLYYQANLSVANLVGGPPNYGDCTLTGGCISLVLGFQETIATNTFNPTTNQGTITFNFTPGGNNFFAIYANTTAGSDLTGACFVCGTQIMSGNIIPTDYNSVFNGGVSSSGFQPLDQFNTDGNNYPTVSTILGSGSVHLDAQITSYLGGYFQGVGGAIIQLAIGDTDTNLPFTSIDPSACFFAATSSGGLTPTCTGAGVAGVSPFTGVGSVGTTNGVSTSNLMFQADAINSFITAPATVPEPATLTLLGIGLVGATRMRRKAKK